MRKRLVAVILTFMLAMVCFAGMEHATAVSAAGGKNVPARPEIGLKLLSNRDSVKLTIGKTADAESFRIYMKAPGEKSYKLVKRIKKDGSQENTYTLQNLADGSYSFKVRAYRKLDGKVYKSSFSKVKTVSITKSFEDIYSGVSESLEFDRPVEYLNLDNPDTLMSPRFFSFRIKKGEKLPEDTVYRLYALNDGLNAFETDLSAVIDETEFSVLPTETGKLNLVFFAYANEKDALTRENPIARSEVLTISLTGTRPTK